MEHRQIPSGSQFQPHNGSQRMGPNTRHNPLQIQFRNETRDTETSSKSLIDTLREEHHFTNARKAPPTNWYAFSTGHGRVKYGANFAMGGRARIELYIDSFDEDWIERLFDRLLAHQTDIESELGSKISNGSDWTIGKRRA